MPTMPYPIELALQIMDEWLQLPEYTYVATVYRFGGKLPAMQVLEAVEIAQTKLPQGGIDAFEYFCGVCNCMIQEQQIRQSWT